MKIPNTTTIFAVSVLLAASICQAEDWPGFRGATGDGRSPETNLPTKWSAEEGIAWQAELQGRGNSSPVVAGGTVYVTAQRKDTSLWLHAFDEASGALRWERNTGEGKLPAKAKFGLYHRDHDAASPTVAANDSLVCALFGTADLVCYDRSGNKLWSRNLNDDYGALDINFGVSFSPRLWQGTLYLSCLSKGPAYVVAIDAGSGKTLWKIDRNFETFVDGNDSYATPAIWKPNDQSGTPRLLVAGADRLAGYDLRDGKQVWVADGLKINSKTGRIIPSPAVAENGWVIQCSGNPQSNGRAIAYRIEKDAAGEIGEDGRIWTVRGRSPDRPTPVCVGGRVYFVRDSAMAFCKDLQTGKTLWEARLAGGKNYASPIAGGGNIYCHNVRGITTVIECGDTFTKVSENQLPGSATYHATPAIANGKLFFRNYETLIAVDGK